MNKGTSLVVFLVLTLLYVLLVWVMVYFGPGGKLFFSVLYLLAGLFLLSGLSGKKRKK